MPDESSSAGAVATDVAPGASISVQVNPQDSVSFRPEPVFISLGLKRDVFTGFGDDGPPASPVPMGIPPVDLKTEQGLLKAFLLLGFEPGPDTTHLGFSLPASIRASAGFRESVGLPGLNVPMPLAVLGQQPPMIRPAMIQNYVAAQASFFQLAMAPLQAKLREARVPFTFGGVPAQEDLRPQLFLVEHYQLASFRGDLARDDLVDSVSLSPGGSITYKVIVRKRKTTSNELTSTVLDSQDREAKENFNKQLNEAADKRSGTNNYDYGFDGSFHGEASVEFGGGSADAQVQARGSTNEVREDFAESTASAIETQVSETNRSRRQSIETTTTGTQIDEQTESVREKTAHNPSAHPVNMGIFLVNEEFVSVLSLVDVEIAYRDGDPNRNAQVPLRKLGELLDTSIARPEDRVEIAATIQRLLQEIADYKGNLHSILKADPSSSFRFSCNGQLRSDYELLGSGGSVRRTFSVKGIPIRGTEVSLRRPNVTVELPLTGI